RPRLAVVAGTAVEIALGGLVLALVPLQLLEEGDGIGDDALVVVAPGRQQGHDVDAGDVVLQLHARVLAGNVARLGVDQSFDVLERPRGHGVPGIDLAGAQQACEHDPGPAGSFVRAPAAAGLLAALEIVNRLADDLVPVLACPTSAAAADPDQGRQRDCPQAGSEETLHCQDLPTLSDSDGK